MKTMKSLLYGLLLVTGLAACSKEYNSNPASNSNAFGGTNPVAPINGAGIDEIVFKENGTTVRLKGAKYLENGNVRTITAVSDPSGGKAYTYSFVIVPYSGAKEYSGGGKSSDTLVISKTIFDIASPSTNLVRYFTGGLSKNIPGYCNTKITDTAGNKLKGQFSGRIVRRDPQDIDKDFGENIEITSGFFNASKYMP